MSFKVLLADPVQKPEDDRFGWTSYAGLIARAIENANVTNGSRVLAIHGDWGSGKTSLKNLVLDSLGGNWESRTLPFSPWLISGSEQIHDQFFAGLISVSREAQPAKGNELKSRLNTLSKMTAASSHVIKLLPSFAALSLLMMGQNEASAVALTAGTTVIETGLAKTAEEVSKLSKELKELVPDDEKKTLHQVREELNLLFKNLGRQILVVIDDIDRLTPTETQTIFQLIKANADFPNIVYLLLFQRSLVEASLGKMFTSDEAKAIKMGRQFLEKVIQIPLTVPLIESSSLLRLLSAELHEVLSRLSPNYDSRQKFDETISDIAPLFKSLRNVQRFVQVVDFVAAAFVENKIFTLDCCDLLRLEAIRYFEPGTLQLLQTKTGWLTNGTPAEREVVLASVQEIASRDMVIALLQRTFPLIAGDSRGLYGGSLAMLINLNKYFSLASKFAPFESEV